MFSPIRHLIMLLAASIICISGCSGTSQNQSDPAAYIKEASDSDDLISSSDFTEIGEAYSGNSINTSIFRKNAISSWANSKKECYYACCYYDSKGNVIVAIADKDFSWKSCDICCIGNIRDAHNSISCMIDGNGFIHVAWSDHNGQLNYVRSKKSCELLFQTELSSDDFPSQKMIGDLEDRVTYPEFYYQPSGNLVFLYRSGESGDGLLVVNQYDTSSSAWTRIHNCLISGEGHVSPYWQACVDTLGRLHISWTWRETADVNSNYNICYAVSTDDALKEFCRSDSTRYDLPITEASAEVICPVPQNSMLINQTSMAVDEDNTPYIATFWRTDGIVQYRILRGKKSEGNKNMNSGFSEVSPVSSWSVMNTGIRTTDFRLDGKGTKRLPCARPSILISGTGDQAVILLLIRDEELQDEPIIAAYSASDSSGKWRILKIAEMNMGEWEPQVDMNAWNRERSLLMYLQYCDYRADKSVLPANANSPAFSCRISFEGIREVAL